MEVLQIGLPLLITAARTLFAAAKFYREVVKEDPPTTSINYYITSSDFESTEALKRLTDENVRLATELERIRKG